jgi:hypothetical protein
VRGGEQEDFHQIFAMHPPEFLGKRRRRPPAHLLLSGASGNFQLGAGEYQGGVRWCVLVQSLLLWCLPAGTSSVRLRLAGDALIQTPIFVFSLQPAA